MPLNNLKGIEPEISYDGLYGKFIDSEDMCNCHQIAGLKQELKQINIIYRLLKFIWDSNETALGSLAYINKLEEELELKCNRYEDMVLSMSLKQHNQMKLCPYCLTEIAPMPDDRIKIDLFFSRERVINKVML